MLITGIRHKIASEVDARRSSLFMRYLIHYLQMFAFLGVFISILLVVDYYSIPQTINEPVRNKYYEVTDRVSDIKYHILTDSYNFIYNIDFYENTTIKDQLTFTLTPIFKTVTQVNHSVKKKYVCKPHNIYGWPLIVVGLTFFCSVYLIIRLWGWMRKRDRINYDSVVNLGLINAFLCLMVILYAFLKHLID